jgi:DNA-binding transcriptional MerR regulator
MDDSGESLRELLTLDELTARVGMSVRNIRFYTTKGLVPPPIRRGRSGYYSPDHVSRLELVQELQTHGFTLSAIEKYMARIPPAATPEDIALHRAMLTPWQADLPVEMSRAELDTRAGRTLTDDDITTLSALGIVFATKRGRYEVAVSQLSVSVGLLDLGFPPEAALAAAEVYAEHGRQLAKELNELFRTMVWPVYRESGASSDTIREVVERLKPLSIASLVSAYEAAMDETRREDIARRAR